MAQPESVATLPARRDGTLTGPLDPTLGRAEITLCYRCGENPRYKTQSYCYACAKAATTGYSRAQLNLMAWLDAQDSHFEHPAFEAASTDRRLMRAFGKRLPRLTNAECRQAYDLFPDMREVGRVKEPGREAW